jgi:hypothetical protein
MRIKADPMTPQAKHNVGFQAPAGRRDGGFDKLDHNTSEVCCGRCGRPVPSGTAVIIVNYHAAGLHQMFCPDHVPPNTRPWRPS